MTTTSTTEHTDEFAHQRETASPSLLARRTSLFWRMHVWAALIASPFALIATLTGMLYIFTPQIESVLYAHLDRVVPAGTMRPLDDAVAAARAAAPAGARLHSVLPAYGPQDTVKVNFLPAAPATSAHGGHGGHAGHQRAAASGSTPAQPAFGLPANAVVVSVDPYTATVTGSIASGERFQMWARTLHSRLLQGDSWRWMIELAASWLMVMLLTGIWLWWPRTSGQLLPQAKARGRRAWRQWHAFIGVALCVITLAILTTGLTWSTYAGDQIRTARNALGQAQPPAPRDLRSVPTAGPEGAMPLSWQATWEAVQRRAPDVALQLTPPRDAQGVWRASAADTSSPTRRFDLQLDAYSGKVLYYAGWDRQTAFSKATAIGIPFHRGEFGWWNQALLLLFGSGMLFSLVSGWVMFSKRRQAGTWGLPKLLPGAWRSVSVTMVLVAVLMFVAMPLLALSAAIVALVEIGISLKLVPASRDAV